jgi:hypothetical protein
MEVDNTPARPNVRANYDPSFTMGSKCSDSGLMIAHTYHLLHPSGRFGIRVSYDHVDPWVIAVPFSVPKMRPLPIKVTSHLTRSHVLGNSSNLAAHSKADPDRDDRRPQTDSP